MRAIERPPLEVYSPGARDGPSPVRADRRRGRREFISLAIGALAGCTGPDRAGEAAAHSERVAFAGSSPTETRSFELAPVSVARWSVTRRKPAMYATLALYHESGRMVQRIVNQSEPGAGETRIRSAGRHYLKVDVLGCEWSIEIETQP